MLVVVLLGAGVLAARSGFAEGSPSRPVVLLDVPFLAQGEDLCGGAAVAMVLRFWGAADVHAEDFAGLVEPARGGITTAALVGAVTSRGWRAVPLHATADDVRAQISRGRPVIGLIRVAGGRHHYVVLIGWGNGRVLLHDPAVGSFRVRSERELLASWEATRNWALLILPPPEEAGSQEGAPVVPPPHDRPRAPEPSLASGCDTLVATAIALAGGGEPEAAESRLAAAVALCPGEGRPLRELGGLRFRQQRWKEAALLSQRAAELDPRDDFTWRLLGASRFLAGDPRGALLAWNRVGEPTLDRVRVDGLERTDVEVVKASLELAPRALLRPEDLERARRRLAEMPTLSSWRLGVEPLGGGRADLRAAVVERRLFDPAHVWLGRGVVDAVTARELRLVAASPTGGGEAIAAGTRWWSGRPAVWITASQPGAFGLPGLATAAGLWDQQSYRVPGVSEGAPMIVREERMRASLSAADWISARSRVGLTLAVDRFDGDAGGQARGSYLSLGTSLERRAAAERAALLGEAAVWLGRGPAFRAAGLRAMARSAAGPARVVVRATVGIEAASRRAPFAVWPGAGTGTVRPFLLRGHALVLDGGIAGAGFGRMLLHGGLEVETRAPQVGPLAIGAAAFLDAARARSRLSGPGWSRTLADVGLGLRFRAPGADGSVRLDVAAPIGSSRWRVSAAWVGRWPGRVP